MLKFGRFTAGLLLCILALPTQGEQGHEIAAADLKLITALQSGPSEVARIAAAKAIGEKHDDRFIEVLSQGLKDPSLAVREAVVAALVECGSHLSVYELESVAGDADQAAGLRLQACQGIGTIAAQKSSAVALAALANLRSASDDTVAAVAKLGWDKAVKQFGSDSLENLSRAGTEAAKQVGGDLLQKGFSLLSPEAAKDDSETKPAAGSTAKPPAPLSDSAVGPFTTNDLEIVNGWRKEQDAHIADMIRGQNQSLSRMRPNSSQRNTARQQITSLEAARTRLASMTPAQLGVGMRQQAARLADEGDGMNILAWLLDWVSDDLFNTRTIITERWSDGTTRWREEDNTGPAILAKLFSVAADFTASQKHAEAKRLGEQLNALSATARAEIDRVAAETHTPRQRGAQ